jgi:hypothetical protein
VLSQGNNAHLLWLLLLLAWLHLLLLQLLLLLHVWLHHHGLLLLLLLLLHLLLRLWLLHLPVLHHAACCIVHAGLCLGLVLPCRLHWHHLGILPGHAILRHACNATGQCTHVECEHSADALEKVCVSREQRAALYNVVKGMYGHLNQDGCCCCCCNIMHT